MDRPPRSLVVRALGVRSITYGSYAQPVIARFWLTTTIRPALKLSLVLKPTCISVSQKYPDSSEYPGDVFSRSLTPRKPHVSTGQCRQMFIKPSDTGWRNTCLPRIVCGQYYISHSLYSLLLSQYYPHISKCVAIFFPWWLPWIQHFRFDNPLQKMQMVSFHLISGISSYIWMSNTYENVHCISDYGY